MIRKLAGSPASFLATVTVVLWSVGMLASCQAQPGPATPTVTSDLVTRPPSGPMMLLLTPISTPAPTPLALAGTPVPSPLVVISPANAGRMVPLARWGKGRVNTIAWSPDGQLLAVASSFGIYFYDAQTLAQTRFIETGTMVHSIAFSPDGTMLASGLQCDTVRLWRVGDGSLIRTLGGHTLMEHADWCPCLSFLPNVVLDVTFSLDGATLAAGSEYGTVWLWRVSDGALVRSLKGRISPSCALGSTYPAFSPDRTLLASASSDEVVRLWQVSDGALLYALEMGRMRESSLAFSPDGTTLATVSGGGVQLRRVKDGSFLRTLEGDDQDSVISIAFSPAPPENGTGGAMLASGMEDGSVWLWRVSDRVLLRKLEGGTTWVEKVAFSPDGTRLASASGEGDIRLWQVSDGALLRTLEEHNRVILDLDFSPSGTTLAAVPLYKNLVQLWQVSDGTLLHTLRGDPGPIEHVAFSPAPPENGPGGAVLATGGRGSTVQLWRMSDETLPPTFKLLHTLVSDDQPTRSAIFSPDGRMLVTGILYDPLELWRVSDGALLRTFEKPPEQPLVGKAFSPDGTSLISVSQWGTVRAWRVSDGAVLYALEERLGEVSGVVFSPDGATLVSWGPFQFGGNALGLQRVNEEGSRWIGDRYGYQVSGGSFSPDGTLVVSAWDDGALQLWRVSDGALLHTLGGHTWYAHIAAFSPDGRLLVSSSADGTIRLWGVVEE